MVENLENKIVKDCQYMELTNNENKYIAVKCNENKKSYCPYKSYLLKFSYAHCWKHLPNKVFFPV